MSQSTFNKIVNGTAKQIVDNFTLLNIFFLNITINCFNVQHI